MILIAEMSNEEKERETDIKERIIIKEKEDNNADKNKDKIEKTQVKDNKKEKIKEKPVEKSLNKSNFSILNELNDFDNKIAEHEKNNKKFNDSKLNSLKDEKPIKKVPPIVIPVKNNKKGISNNSILDNPNDFNLLDDESFKANDSYNYDKDKKLNNSKKINDDDILRKNLFSEKPINEGKKKTKIVENEDDDFNDDEKANYNYKDEKIINLKHIQNKKNYSNNQGKSNNMKYSLNDSKIKSGQLQEKESKSRTEQTDKNNKNNMNKPKSILEKDKVKKHNNNNNNYDNLNSDRQKNVDKE